MWECPECGTQEIAGSLEICPGCRAQRPKEDAVAEPGGSPPDEDETPGAFPAGKQPRAPSLPKRKTK